MAESFDLREFIGTIKELPRDLQQSRVREELARVQCLVVREPTWKFKQQMYVKRLGRLALFLKGENVESELTPSEAEAYALLRPAPGGAAAASVAGGAPAPAPSAAASATAASEATAAAPPVLTGAERRRSTRIRMRTRARIRREATGTTEVVEPANVSKGGLSFRSRQSYEMNERLLVNMHYQPGQPETAGMEQLAVVVRVIPDTSGQSHYGLEFIP